MSTTKSMRRKLDFLIRTTGRAEAEIVAEAVEEGLTELYRRHIADAYLAGRIDRDKAVSELGKDVVDDLDYAREAVGTDVAWGLKSA